MEDEKVPEKMCELKRLDVDALEAVRKKSVVRTLGRTDKEHPFTFFWTASGLEMSVHAGEVWAEVYTDYEDNELWADVIIDGAPIERRMLPKGESRICLVRNLDPSIERNIKIVRDTQAMSGESASIFKITGIRIKGELVPVPQRPYRIEFIGDSITSGEGTRGALLEMEWKSFVFSAVDSYPFFTAIALNAEYRVFSQSGWGCYASWDGVTAHALPPYYREVCSVLRGEINEREGCKKPYDFSCWQPDAVVINLGTNDSAAKEQGAVEDRILRRGFHESAVHFLETVRRCNPGACIVWAYGMLGHGFEDEILSALKEYRESTGDKNVFYLPLPETREGQYGSRQHPGVKSHEAAAKLLSAFLLEKQKEGQKPQ